MSRVARFDGRQAIVTGAGSGIGAALCRALANAGAEVMCTDIDGEAAQRTADALATPGSARQLDVTDAAAVKNLVDDVVERSGRIDLMFNNAGITWGGDTELLTLDQSNAIIDVNIRGVVHGRGAGQGAGAPLPLRSLRRLARQRLVRQGRRRPGGLPVPYSQYFVEP